MGTPLLRPIKKNRIVWNNKKFLFFGGYDYHRLSRNPQVLKAAHKALRRCGMNCGGSRVTTGNHPLHADLEREISQFLHTEDSISLATGFMANLALLESLKESDYLCLCDENMHPSLKMAVRSSGLPFEFFNHQDPQDLKSKLSPDLRPCIITDGISDTLPPLCEYLQIAEEKNGLLIVDEAHSIGVIGETGRGSCEALNCVSPRIVITGSLSKAPGTGGGFVSGIKEIIDPVRATITYGTTSAPPLPVSAAGIASLKILGKRSDKVRRLQEISVRIKKALKEKGYALDSTPVPVIAVRPSTPDKADALYAHLKEENIYPPLISYAGKPAYFRFTLASSHTDRQLKHLQNCLESFIEKGAI